MSELQTCLNYWNKSLKCSILTSDSERKLFVHELNNSFNKLSNDDKIKLVSLVDGLKDRRFLEYLGVDPELSKCYMNKVDNHYVNKHLANIKTILTDLNNPLVDKSKSYFNLSSGLCDGIGYVLNENINDLKNIMDNNKFYNNVLVELINDNKFNHPKSVKLIEDCLSTVSNNISDKSLSFIKEQINLSLELQVPEVKVHKSDIDLDI